jgi:type VI secretion system protein ImpB
MLNVPKSRVTIEYVNTTGGARERKELPLRLLMVGDYTFKEPDPEDLLAEREKIEINKRNFNEVMRKQGLSLNFTVPNRLAAEEGEEMAVNLKIDDLSSFRPEAIAPQVEELKTIMGVRDLLLALKSHVVSKRQFRRELEKIVKGDLDSAMKEFAALGYLPGEEESESEDSEE